MTIHSDGINPRDNEKLIDAAEAMTADEIHQHPMAALDKLRALARELRAADKAHTPTDDEREADEKAIMNALYDSREALMGVGAEAGTDETAILVDRMPEIILALGFRRSEVPEPSAIPSARELRALNEISERSDLDGFNEEDFPEPQGELSDAWAEADRQFAAGSLDLGDDRDERACFVAGVEWARAAMTSGPRIEIAARAIYEIRDDAYDLDEWEQLDRAQQERYVCDARAALRAAAAVTEQGEKP